MKWKLPLIAMVLALGGSTMLCSQATLTNDGAEITITNGAAVTVNGNVSMVNDGTFNSAGELFLTGDFVNNSGNDGFNGSGSVILNGIATQSVSGTNPLNVGFLNLDNGTGAVLETGLSVTNELNLIQGSVDLNGFDIEIGPSGQLVGETESNRIFGSGGTIHTTRMLNAPSADNVANLGLELTSTSDLGMTTIERGHTDQMGVGNTGIQRYYDVSPTNNSGLGATMRFHYLDAETNGQAEGGFILYRSTDGGTTWNTMGGTVNAGGNYVELAGVDAFSRWTVSNEDTDPLTGLFSQSKRVLDLNVFPQPATLGQMTYLQGLPEGEYDLFVVDASGRMIQQVVISSFGPEAAIGLRSTGLSAGQYFFRAVSRDRETLASGKLLLVK